MKILKTLLALASLALISAGPLAAAEKQPAGKPAACCAKSTTDGKSCTHSCCAEASQAGKNCEKCGGKNESKAEKKS